MAIQVNIPLKATSGLDIPAGSYVVIDIHTDPRKFLEATILFYKDKTSYDSITPTPFLPDNPGLQPRYLKQLNNAEYAALTTLNLHQSIQIYLETFFGPGTTTLVQ